MIKVRSIRVRSFDLDHLDIFWELEDFTSSQTERLEEYDFQVIRSVDGAAGPYHPLSGTFYSTFHFRDGDVNQLHKWRTYFYRIKIIHRESGDEELFGPVSLEADPDRLAMEIRRRESYLLKEWAGRMVLVYPRITFGPRCGHCWDRNEKGNTIGRSKQQNCPTCFDTTYVGGYARPMLVPMQIDPAPIQPQKTDLGEHQFIETTARALYFPPIKPKDLIIEAENKRWRVKGISFTEKGRARIRQELKLRQYPMADIKHVVPVSMDLLKNVSPEKAKKRLMDIQDGQTSSSVGDYLLGNPVP